MYDSGMQPVELQVRITLFTDAVMEATIFPLGSHRNDPPIDTLAGFLNKRRHEFYMVQLADGSEMLLQLRHSFVFELTHQTDEMMKAINPYMASRLLTSDPQAVASYSPVALALTSNRIVRGDLWFYNFEPEEERNVAAGLNREARYICIHGERSTFFVRRSAIMKAQLAAVPGGQQDLQSVSKSHPLHVTKQSGLIDVTDVQSCSAGASSDLVRLPSARDIRVTTPQEAPLPAGLAAFPPGSQPIPSPWQPPAQSNQLFPKGNAPLRERAESFEDSNKDNTKGQGIDERHWY